jgi:hypothetical protein
MNFADGTRMIGGRDYLEVRDRDYFFTPGFMLFSLAVGAGVSGLIQILRESVKASKAVMAPLSMLMVACGMAFPALSIAGNYAVSDRSGNYIPYDYAKNLLASARKNAILITGGDNDTFPVWALQSVYRYRTDVTNLNLSLANADWYLKEMRDRHNVPLALSDQQIEGLRPGRTPEGRFVRIQEQVVDYLIATSDKSDRPIDFAITVPSSGRQFRGKSVDNRLTLSGRAYHLRSDASGFKYDPVRSEELIFGEFSFRSMGVDGVYQDWISKGTTNSYANDFARLASEYRRAGRTDDLIRVLELEHNTLPEVQQLTENLLEAYSEGGKADQIPAFINACLEAQRIPLIKSWAQIARRSKQIEEAVSALTFGADQYPADKEIFYGLIVVLNEAGQVTEMQTRLEGWIMENPSDTNAQNFLAEIRSGASAASTDSTNSTAGAENE